ncbi:MAG: TonB-dependent receptor [Pseudomonadota bacterium]
MELRKFFRRGLEPALCVLAASAQAQEPVDATPERVLVTAKKFLQSVQDVPAALTVLSGKDLQEAGSISLYDIATAVPALQVWQNARVSNTGLRIRGIANNPNIPNFDPSVTLAIDGIAVPRTGFSVDDLVDIARIEVLDGPQSTLYGKSATAGVINILTREPGKQFSAHTGASFSRMEGGRTATVWRAEGALSGPLSDTVSAALSMVRYEQGHLFRNLFPFGDANSVRTTHVRGQLLFELGQGKLRLTASRSHGDSDNTDPEIDQGDPRNPLFGLCPDQDSTNRVICTIAPVRNRFDSDLASATLTLPLAGAGVTLLSGYNGYDDVMTQGEGAQLSQASYRVNDRQRGRMVSHELRLSGLPGAPLAWLLGYYFGINQFREGDGKHAPFFLSMAQTAEMAASVGPFGAAGYLNSFSRTRSQAVFGQANWQASEHVRLSAGLRWQHDAIDATVDNAVAGLGGFVEAVTPVSANAELAHTANSVSSDASAQYQLSANAMAYLDYATGAKPGGFNVRFGAIPLADRPFNDERVQHLELGSKNRLLGEKLRLDGALFYDHFRDYQNTGFVGGRFLVNNAERVIARGASLSADYAVARTLKLYAAVIVADTFFDKYTRGACGYQETAINGACDRSGQQLPQAARRQANAGWRETAALGFGELYASMNWRWNGGYHTNTNLDPRNVQGAFSLLDARIGLRSGKRYDAVLWGRNLLNRTVVMEDAANNRIGIAGPALQRYLGTPREIGASLRLDW